MTNLELVQAMVHAIDHETAGRRLNALPAGNFLLAKVPREYWPLVRAYVASFTGPNDPPV